MEQGCIIKFEETLSLAGIDLLIIEGEYTLCDSTTYDFLKYSTLRIFMHTRAEDMIEWTWQRGRAIQEQTKQEFIANAFKQLKLVFHIALLS